MSAEDRKQAIVKAALPLFARKGFARTTTRELAKAAGVSEPLLYRHFPSKEALYTAIQDFGHQGRDPIVQKLKTLTPSTSTLVHLVYFLMRALILGRPSGAVAWETRYRLMVRSFLEDGAFARMLYRNRFDCFSSRIEACLDAAIGAGDAVNGPISKGNRARFAHHVGAWVALGRLPQKPTMDYKVPPGRLLDEAVWFVLRGMGLTDRALAAHYNPKTLAFFFEEQ